MSTANLALPPPLSSSNPTPDSILPLSLTNKLGSDGELIEIGAGGGEDLNSRVASIHDVDFLFVVDEEISGETKFPDAFAFAPECKQRGGRR